MTNSRERREGRSSAQAPELGAVAYVNEMLDYLQQNGGILQPQGVFGQTEGVSQINDLLVWYQTRLSEYSARHQSMLAYANLAKDVLPIAFGAEYSEDVNLLRGVSGYDPIRLQQLDAHLKTPDQQMENPENYAPANVLLTDAMMGFDYKALDVTPLVIEKIIPPEKCGPYSIRLPLVVYENVNSPKFFGEALALSRSASRLIDAVGFTSVTIPYQSRSFNDKPLSFHNALAWKGWARSKGVRSNTPVVSAVEGEPYRWDESTLFNWYGIQCGQASWFIRGIIHPTFPQNIWSEATTVPDVWENSTWANTLQMMTYVVTQHVINTSIAEQQAIFATVGDARSNKAANIIHMTMMAIAASIEMRSAVVSDLNDPQAGWNR